MALPDQPTSVECEGIVRHAGTVDTSVGLFIHDHRQIIQRRFLTQNVDVNIVEIA